MLAALFLVLSRNFKIKKKTDENCVLCVSHWNEGEIVCNAIRYKFYLRSWRLLL